MTPKTLTAPGACILMGICLLLCGACQPEPAPEAAAPATEAEPAPAIAEAEPAAPAAQDEDEQPGADELPVAEDFAEATEAEITTDNYGDELAKLTAEIEADSPD